MSYHLTVEHLFELEIEDYDKAIRVSNFYSNNYVQYESNGDKDKNLSFKKELNKLKPHLKEIRDDLEKSDT